MRDEATQRQVDAANPTSNTWLSANAGSGKTRVLTDRVARLLLEGVAPQNVLCLTYTKAAASEMQNRLFKRLGEWAMLEDAPLRAQLADLGVTHVENLARARRLFATAIETPGGLKVQTIHAFCAAILRRFPMEAGVSPDFKEMDDRSGTLLQMEIAEDMAEGPERPLVQALARYHSGAEFEKLLNDIVGKRLGFLAETDAPTIWSWFDLEPGFDDAQLVDDIFTPDVKSLIPSVIGPLSGHSKTMVDLADKLRSIPLDPASAESLSALEKALLTQAGTVRKGLLTKGAHADLDALGDRLYSLADRVAENLELKKCLYSARKTLALHQFSHAFVERYESRKAQRGWLDFDDLIQRASALLNQSDVAQWVLYRLDGGIDHILVDEAQDTSPAQWQVIDSLAREFMSGEGAHSGRDWSIFVVGDPKQSIYSFQGADPVAFAEMRDRFNQGLGAVHKPLQQLPLEYSFRSAPIILEAVDVALSSMPGLGDVAPSHKAFHDAKPGRVDLWPLLEPVKDPEPEPWDHPLDVPADTDHNVVLAESIAIEIERMLREERLYGKDDWHPVTAGDIIVLVQRRSDLFHHIIRACKARGLPIAGADRLRIGGEMAVKDLTALLRFLATPEDDLSLASALRSPLLRWSEDDLYRLAQPREGFLWRALRDSTRTDTTEILRDLLDQADFLRPYDLIDRILTRHDGRRFLIGQLGHEAQDGIDAMLAQALAYEQMEVPSLTGFLTWLDAEEVEIKRQMDSDAREIRVMTVHGSKGLEAPIVILPDTAKRQSRGRGDLVDLNGNVVWKPAANDTPAMLGAVMEASRDKEAEERMRLLYVAMTRAESWLIIAGAGEPGKETADSWHGIVEAGLTELGASKQAFPTGLGLRIENGDWPGIEPHEVASVTVHARDLPDWAMEHAPRLEKPAKTLVPSDLGGAKVVPGATEALDGEAAKRRGRQIHRLLEFLGDYPEADWPHHAAALLAFGEDAANPAEVADLLDEARAVLTAADLQHLFSGTALAEVELSAPINLGSYRRVHGIIDRLIITPTKVLAVDFKSNRTIPERPDDIPEGILRQLGAYETALAEIYPDREIASAVLWTRAALFMELPPGLALRAFGRLDGTPAAT